MANNKKALRSVNNKNQPAFEFDYEKFAEALIKAQEKATTEKEKSERKSTRFRNILLSNMNGILYHGLAIWLVLFIISVWAFYAKHMVTSLLGCILLTVFLALLAIVSFLCGQETMNDTYEKTVALFNTNISLLALIVAIIALFKEMA